MSKEKRQPFKYKRRSPDSFERQANKASGSYDRMFKEQYKEFKPTEGDHRIRIMPPTFEGAEHYALPIYVHREVGPDNQQYLCLSKMKQEPCPVCEEYARARREGEDEKYTKKLRPSERRVAWVIDRNHEDEGPLVYNMPVGKQDKRICAVAKDQETGETLWLDDPDKGYDIFFKRTGTRLNTDYTGHAPGRRESPLSRDEATQEAWLKYINKHPLDETLLYYDYDHIATAASGSVSRKEQAEDDDGPSTRSEEHEKARKEFRQRIDQRGNGRVVDEDEDDDDDEKPRRSKAQMEDDDDDEPKARSRKSRAEPEDEDPEGEPRRAGAASDDDDDDDEPAPRSTKRKAQAKKDDDDEDDDDDENETLARRKPVRDDDDDDEPAPRRTAAKRKDDDDDDDDESSDDEDDAPRAKAKPAAKKSRVTVPADDEDDD